MPVGPLRQRIAKFGGNGSWNFIRGEVQRFLPNFAVLLKRTPHLSPYHASFVVPLWFNKFDLRDYLLNAYGVRILHQNTTVYVKQGQIVEGDPALHRPKPGQKRRVKSTKHMTVELLDPFVWPTTESSTKAADEWKFDGKVDNDDPWRPQEKKSAKESNTAFIRKLAPGARLQPDEDRRKALREQAEGLLRGTEEWRPGHGKGY